MNEKTKISPSGNDAKNGQTNYLTSDFRNKAKLTNIFTKRFGRLTVKNFTL